MELFFCSGLDDRTDSYALLTYAVRQVWGLYTLPNIARSAQGKPFFPDHPQCQFNLSHSGSFALCALDASPVGADIETIRPHHPRLAQRICSPAELEWVNTQANPQRALLALWTKKEARVKQSGTGLIVPLREIAVPLTDGDAVLDGLYFRPLSGPDWVGTVCGHSFPTELHTVPVDMLKKLDTIGHK